MRQRRISPQKQRHEVSRYLRRLEKEVYDFADSIRARIEVPTVRISKEGTGAFYLPSLATVQRVMPDNTPTGLIFADGSFLTFYEVVRFGYRDESETEPRIYRLRYGYHYQRNDDYFYFRFDHHPSVGGAATHPLHHLHSAGWLNGERQFQDVPRYEVKETTLAQVLRLLLVSFPTITYGGRE